MRNSIEDNTEEKDKQDIV